VRYHFFGSLTGPEHPAHEEEQLHFDYPTFSSNGIIYSIYASTQVISRIFSCLEAAHYLQWRMRICSWFQLSRSS
jgi:hypothetical protein